MNYEPSISTPERSVRIARPGYPLHNPRADGYNLLARILESYLLAGYTPEEIVEACKQLNERRNDL